MNPEEKASLANALSTETKALVLYGKLDQLQKATGDNFDQDERFELTTTALTRLREASREDPTLLRQSIVGYVLPACMFEATGGHAGFNLYLCRELLGEWLNELPTSWYLPIVEECYDLLIKSIHEGHINAATTVIAEIGYRSQKVIDVLNQVVQSASDDAKIHAIGTLISLGDFETHRSASLSIAHQASDALQLYRVSHILARLADPRSLDMIANQWLSREAPPLTLESGSALISVLGGIAKHTNDPQIRDRAGMLLLEVEKQRGRETQHSLLIQGDFLSRIDSAWVSKYLIGALGTVTPDTKDDEGTRRLAFSRLSECWLPAQLQGCATAPSASALSALKRDLLTNEGYDGRNATPLSWLKESEVTGLLRMGGPELLDWFEELLAYEKSPYIALELTEALSIFRFDRIPEKLKSMVAEKKNLTTEDDADFLLRLAAIRLVRNSGSTEAFSILLNPGLLYNGNVMRDTVEALAEVTLAKAADEGTRQEIVSSVFQALQQDLGEPTMSAVCRTINALALAGYLKHDFIAPLETFLNAKPEGPEAFNGSMAVQALGTFPKEALSNEILASFATWAAERDDWLGWRSTEAIINLGLFEQSPPWLNAKLGLSRSASGWQWSASAAQSEWASVFVVLLFGKYPQQFANALASALLDDSWEASERAVLTLVDLCRRRGLPEEPTVGQALIKRATTRNRPNSADLRIFSHLASLSPMALNETDWKRWWPNWTPDARAALADSFGQAPVGTSTPSSVESLKLLLTDPHFGVRRAAARALATVNQSELESLFLELCSSTDIVERVRAAEISVFASNELRDVPVGRLAKDSVRRVRIAAKEANFQHRSRVLAADYWGRVKDLKDPSNDELLPLIKYVQALADVGDDSTLAEIALNLRDNEMSPRVRFMKSLLYKELDKEWGQRRGKWPQALSQIKGSFHKGTGALVTGDRTLPGGYSIWRRAGNSASDHLQWGGEIEVVELNLFTDHLGENASVVLEDGSRGVILITSTSASSGKPTKIQFAGSGPFPSPVT